MGRINFLRYYDEVFSVFFLIVFFMKSIKKKFIVTKKIKSILLFSIIILLLGIVSNVLNKQQSNSLAIILDIIANFKIVLFTVGFYLLFDKNNYHYIINFFSKLSKLFLILGFVFGVISLFIDLGMGGQERFGIIGFNFIFNYAHIYATFILMALLFILKKYPQKSLIYVILAFFQLVLTTKGTSIVTAVMMILIYYFIKKQIKISRFGAIIPISLITVLLGRYQITTYFLKESPRKLFLEYSLTTLKKFFPLGSGFATFGSDMAGKYYSNLYYSYGFQYYWGMNPHDYSFLNDNYWPMVLGQFGILGFALTFISVLYMCSIFLKKRCSNEVKIGVMVSLFYLLLASLGTTIFTTSSTLLLMIVLIIVTNDEEEIII
ncbi:MAG: hypothetical protein ACI4WW_02905 [Candidatus Coprovivens sp.]